MPALLTSTSSLPKCSVVAATTAAQSSSLVTSSGWNRAKAPMASATCWPTCSSTSAITTFAPSRAKMRAVAAPMPEAPPEMMATLPASLMVVLPSIGPTARVEPPEHRCGSHGHQADAYKLTGLSRAVQSQSDPHHDEPGQGQNVHAVENVPGQHPALPSCQAASRCCIRRTWPPDQ